MIVAHWGFLPTKHHSHGYEKIADTSQEMRLLQSQQHRCHKAVAELSFYSGFDQREG